MILRKWSLMMVKLKPSIPSSSMERLFSLAIEGLVVGAIIGFFASFVTENAPISIGIAIIIGIVLRILIDFIWKIYNRIAGKSLD